MLLTELEAVVASRANANPEQSYTARLLADPELVQRKIMEEAFEVCLELQRDDRSRLHEEAADLVYHLLVGLAGAGVSVSSVLSELEERRQ